MPLPESSPQFNIEEPVYLTSKGLEELKKELEEINKEIPIAVRALEEASQQGDRSESAEYDVAKEKQERLFERKKEVENILSRAVIITKEYIGNIQLGSSVSLKKEGSDEEEKYTLVGPEEPGLLLDGKISHESPLGSALIGKKKGERVEAITPIGKLIYIIEDVG